MKVNVTYAIPAEGATTQLPEGTQSMIGSYQVTGVAEFAKQMEDEGEFVFGASVAGAYFERFRPRTACGRSVAA